MDLIKKAVATVRSYTIFDIAIFKICLIAFTLMIAKCWPVVLQLEWYWYGVIFVITYLWLLRKFFATK